MKKLDLGQTISVLANLGVIAGIFFLGLELRQNNELLLQEAQRSRAAAVRENTALIAENAELVVKDEAGDTLTAAESIRMSSMWTGMLISYQTAFRQLPRQAIAVRANGFRRMFATMPSFRETWEQSRDEYEPDFVAFMEENVVGER